MYYAGFYSVNRTIIKEDGGEGGGEGVGARPTLAPLDTCLHNDTLCIFTITYACLCSTIVGALLNVIVNMFNCVDMTYKLL